MTFDEFRSWNRYRKVKTCLCCLHCVADLRCGKYPQRFPVGASCRCDSWEAKK